MTTTLDPAVNTKNYEKQGGDTWIVGGTLDIAQAAGGKLTIDGADVTAAVATGGIAGVAAGYKLARGEVTLDGSNPTPVTTGLATVVAAVASFKTAVALGDDPNALSVDYGGSVAAGELDIHAWKNISGTDPTQVASTNSSMVISWIAIGT